MRQCLYCQQDSPADLDTCPHCGMPLPAATAEARTRRKQRRFIWFCLALLLFCLGMMLWLPRVLFPG